MFDQKGPKRRLFNNILIQKQFQLKLLYYSSVVFVSYTILIFLGVFYFSWKFKTMGEASGFTANHSYFGFLKEQENALLIFYSMASVVGLIILIFTMLQVSHRVAGPMYRLNQHLKSIADDPTKLRAISFRKGDLFQDVEANFNRMVNALSNKDQKK